MAIAIYNVMLYRKDPSTERDHRRHASPSLRDEIG